MRVALCALIVAAVASCERASEPIVEIRLPRPKPVVGDQYLMVEDVTMDVTYGGGIDYESRQHLEALIKLVAVDGYVVRIAEVTYKAIDDTQTMDGEREKVSDPRAGRTYQVSRSDAGPYAIPMSGGGASEEELALVAGEYETIGIEDELEKIFAEKTWKTGEKVALTPDEVARANAQRVGTSQQRRSLLGMELTLRSVKGGVARFSLGLGLRYEEPSGSYDVHLRGETSFDLASGRSLEVIGRGPVTGTIGGSPTKGTMSWKMTSRWAASR